VWNIRGLNDLVNQRKVRSFVKRINVYLICLIETSMKVEKTEKIKENVVQGWGFLNNYEIHQLGRIGICWNKDVMDVNLLKKHDQAISCEICVDHGRRVEGFNRLFTEQIKG
jgi:hypothetical protein